MFIGHFGAGFYFKKAAPALSLGLIFLAVQFLDLLWPTLVLLNVEHVSINTGKGSVVPLTFTDYPYSHSMVMAMVWAFLFAIIYWLIKRKAGTAFILGIAVFSHWVLDLIVHLPDLPIYPGGSIKLGFGLWNYPVLTALLEGGIFLGGLFYYLRNTRARNTTGTVLIWVIVLLLIIFHLGNIFSPPPPSAKIS